jgi:hypothetical protein
LWRHQTIFGDQTADLIRLGDTMTLDFIADAMQRLHILLFHRFHPDRMHVGPVHCLANRLRIIGIVLVTLDKRLYELRRDDLDHVTSLF